MITLDRGSATISPLTCQVQVVGAFSADMSFADVVLNQMLESDTLGAVKIFSYEENFGVVSSD